MSSDDQKQNKQEPVDIDQLEVNIFIIAKNPDSLNNSVQFLTRRGWPTSCAGSISKAIATIVKESPDIVMISVDHPNPNVSRLPILLAQTLNTICIGFTEDGGAISINKLNKSRFKYKFTGFPSGPSLHRFIRQTLDGIYNPQEIQSISGSAKKSGKDEDNTIQVKGSKSKSTIKIAGESSDSRKAPLSGSVRTKLKDIQEKEKKSNMNLSAAEMLRKLSSGEDLDPIKKQDNHTEKLTPSEKKKDHMNREDSELKESESSYYQNVLKNSGSQMTEEEKSAKKARVESKKKAFPWQKQKDEEDIPIKNQKNRPGATFEINQKRNKFQPDADDPLISEGKKSKPRFDIQHGEKSKNNVHISEMEEKKKQRDEDILSAEEKQKKKFNQNSSEKINKKMSGENEEYGVNKISNKETLDSIGNTKNKKNFSESIVAEGKILSEEEDKFKESVHRALKESCKNPDPNVRIEIKEIEKVGVIPVDSQKIHGYFLVGRGRVDLKPDIDFLKVLSEAVEKQLASQGINVHCQKSFFVETENFDLDQFSKKIENFTIFEQSGPEEIAVTFVPTKSRIPHLQDSDKSSDMARISAVHLSTQFPINVNSYIYLKKNDRFYKYLNAGSKILPRQKEKLISKEGGASGLHINKNEFEKFKQYVAEILVYELITKVKSEKNDSEDSSDEAA